MCRIVVFGTSGPARPADIGLKIRSTFLCLAVHRWPIFRRSTTMHGFLPWRVAIIDKSVGDKNHGFESCQSSEQIASSPVVGFWRLRWRDLCLLLAINVVRLALEAEEDNRA